MAQISVARALTKLKTTKAKMDSKLLFIATHGYGNSKTNSSLAKVSNVEGNHKDITAQVSAAIQSYKDLLKYYRAVTLAVQESNLKTQISTEAFGTIPIADAMVIVTKLSGSMRYFSDTLNKCITKADESADAYNKKAFSKSITDNIDAATANLILAQPCVYFNTKEATQAKDTTIFLDVELNSLINESNAITMIEVPDEVN